MKKKDEISFQGSCLNQANDDELIFILRAKDLAAPDTIRTWVGLRLERGKNQPFDAQILEALDCAAEMDRYQRDGNI